MECRNIFFAVCLKKSLCRDKSNFIRYNDRASKEPQIFDLEVLCCRNTFKTHMSNCQNLIILT